MKTKTSLTPLRPNFWDYVTDETLSLNQHIELIATKLCSACYVLRNIKHIVPQTTLRTIYYVYIHSILNHVVIFWGNLPMVINHSSYKRKLLEFCPTQEQENLVGKF
jgi:hypothetical protein